MAIFKSAFFVTFHFCLQEEKGARRGHLVLMQEFIAVLLAMNVNWAEERVFAMAGL